MRLSIPAKIFLGYAAVLAAFGMVTAFGVLRLHALGDGLQLVSQSYHKLTRIGAQLESSYRNSVQATDRLLDETDARAREALLLHAIDYQPQVAREKIRAAQGIVQLARESSLGREETPFLDRVEGLLAAMLLRYDRYAFEGGEVRRLIAKREAAREDEKAAVETELDASVRRLKSLEQAIGAGIKDFGTELETRIDQLVRQIGMDERRSAFLVLVFSLLAVAVALFVTALSQRTLAPIRRLTEAVKDVGEGRFFRQVAWESDDELGLLAREFNAMAKKLAERDKQLSEKTAEVLRSERLAAVGRLAAQITHEIRNPLSSLSLNAELLQEQIEQDTFQGPASRAEARALIKAMAREVDRLAEVTEEYLRFARLPKPSLAAVDLNDAVDELADFMTAEFAAAKVVVERHLSPESPSVRADAGQLRQLLLNLLRNAREATGEGGHVRLVTRLDPERRVALMEVSDDGPGIPDDVKARIFEPFFSTKERGTGLGLALVQQIVHEHGGELSCESAPGAGTRMVVAFPLAAAAAAPADAPLALAH